MDLAHVKRIFVEPLTGGPGAPIRCATCSSAAIQNSKLFIVTDNQNRADATLTGSSDDKVFHRGTLDQRFRSGSIRHYRIGQFDPATTWRRRRIRPHSSIGAGGSPTTNRAIFRSGGTRLRHRFAWWIPDGDVIWCDHAGKRGRKVSRGDGGCGGQSRSPIVRRRPQGSQRSH